MPRTKCVNKKRNYSNVSTGSQSSDGKSSLKSSQNNLMIITDINRNFDAQMLKLDKQVENSIKLLRRAYDIVIFKIPTAMLNKPPVDCVRASESGCDNSPMVSSTVDHYSSPKIQDNQAKCMAQQTLPSKSNTLSTSKDGGHGDEQMLLTTASSYNRFRTPNCNIGAGGRYNLITPKMQPNSVLSVLRRPREGEMAVSMSGSPLLVSSTTHESMANVNVPLPNGLVMSILPQVGLRPHDMPDMDMETLKQLKQLKDNLASFLKEDS